MKLVARRVEVGKECVDGWTFHFDIVHEVAGFSEQASALGVEWARPS